jgi:hypothetical protein
VVARTALLALFKDSAEYRYFFRRLCERSPYRLRAQAWQFAEELADRGMSFELSEVEDALWELARELMPDSPAATWDTEWAGELAEKALRYLQERHVPGADLTALEPFDEEVVAAGFAEDRHRYRQAVREYVKAGLREFDRAREAAA